MSPRFDLGDRVRYDSDVFKDSWGVVTGIQHHKDYLWYFVTFDDSDSSLNNCRFMPEQLIREEPMLALAGCLEPNQIENVS